MFGHYVPVEVVHQEQLLMVRAPGTPRTAEPIEADDLCDQLGDFGPFSAPIFVHFFFVSREQNLFTFFSPQVTAQN